MVINNISNIFNGSYDKKDKWHKKPQSIAEE
jgi:hypothetical protein